MRRVTSPRPAPAQLLALRRQGRTRVYKYHGMGGLAGAPRCRASGAAAKAESGKALAQPLSLPLLLQLLLLLSMAWHHSRFPCRLTGAQGATLPAGRA